MMKQPIDSITWVHTDQLDANDYNPNYVLTPELKLLKVSMLKQGWIQPVLVVVQRGEDGEPNGRYTIVDGFHRSTLTRTDKDVGAMTEGKVPCAVLDIDDAERKMLTVRINRAKGSHIAAKMHDLITSLVSDHNVPIKQLCQELGMEKSEVELLLTENVFAKLDIPNHPYSRAWGVADRTK